MTQNTPREINPDDAHSIAPDISADAAAVPANAEVAPRSVASAAFARGPRDTTALPPLDHAAIRTIIAGIMVAMFISALEQTIVAPALPAIGRALFRRPPTMLPVGDFMNEPTACPAFFKSPPRK